MTHEATVQASSSAAIVAAASAPGDNSLPSPRTSAHGHTHKADDTFLLTLRPLLKLYESPTSPAWGYRK